MRTKLRVPTKASKKLEHECQPPSKFAWLKTCALLTHSEAS